MTNLDIENTISKLENFKKNENDKPIIAGLNVIIAALERDLPKRIKKVGELETCPNCGTIVNNTYCSRCGQRLILSME